MGRPEKLTVEYFSHDANASEGRTLSILENHFGHDGYAAWFKLLERISSTRNHVISIRNPEDIEFLAAKMGFKPQRLTTILAKLAELEAIDPELYKHGMVWCQNFVDRLKPVYSSRHQTLPEKPIKEPPLIAKETPLIAKETPLSPEKTPVSLTDNTQTKGTKETKLKKERVKENPIKQKLGSFNNVFLTSEEYSKLIEKFGQGKTNEKIESLSQGIASKGYKYLSHYATILNWDRRDNGTHQQGTPRALTTKYTRPEDL